MVMEGNRLFSTLEQYVMDYNRNSDDCHITIQRDLSRLDAELVSSNPPDLINLTYMDYIKYGEKDVLEDLEPYLESSILLDRKDFREAVLDSCTVKGRLVCIPDEIECTTVIGRASQLGSGAGWTAADVMAFAESHPDARLFKNNTFSAMIKTFFRDYDFTSGGGIREEIINIIVEEVSPCLNGAREYEEAAAIVQNRVRNMVQE